MKLSGLPSLVSPPSIRAISSLLSLVILVSACGGGDGSVAVASSPQPTQSAERETSEDDQASLVDYGKGPIPETERSSSDKPLAIPLASAELTSGGPLAAAEGAFGPAFPFPLIPIHLIMLPDGRLLAYGSDEKGRQTAQLHYAVYDPEAQGYPFLVLPNTTNTDLFCSTQTLLPQDGRVMLAGGDRIVNGERNYANADVNIFEPKTGKMEKQAQPMTFQRWYATSVITPKGEHMVLGGRDDKFIDGVTVDTYATTPEIYNPATGWRTLLGARSDPAFGKARTNWRYPKSWVSPAGRIAVLTHSGSIFQLDPAGLGAIQPWMPSSGSLLSANADQPAVMFKPGKILAARVGTSAQVIDINGTQPIVRNTGPLHSRRIWGSMTLLPDGRVWANGGSSDGENELSGAVYSSELWNPASETWTLAASATKPRLYHGNAILLRDGRVLTGGGGAPGPVKGLNAEIYYPPYLFKKDGSGEFATRPAVSSLSTRSLLWSSQLGIQMTSTELVKRIALLRAGSATHSFNGDQRLIGLTFTQSGRDLVLTMPGSRNNAPPGYYMVFILNNDGVPSIGEMIKLG